MVGDGAHPLGAEFPVSDRDRASQQQVAITRGGISPTEIDRDHRVQTDRHHCAVLRRHEGDA